MYSILHNSKYVSNVPVYGFDMAYLLSPKHHIHLSSVSSDRKHNDTYLLLTI